MLGKIHSFDTFGTVDGPGIRFVLFMQGCPLRCKYCHNADTIARCGGKEYTPEQMINEIVKYKNYYDLSGGGLTITGGEPFMQPGFLLELLKLAKQNDIHTCVDTSGFTNLKLVDPILDYTDLVLLDIKHMDSNKCIELTGQDNKRNLLFAHHLSERSIPVWIRYVLVPGITDDKEDLIELGRFIKTLDNVQQVDVLQYHKLGEFKWKELGLKYPLEGVMEATETDVKRAYKLMNLK